MKVFLCKIIIKSNGNCIVELLILLMILDKFLKTSDFNSIVISVLIILLVVSTRQAFNQNNFFISLIKELFFGNRIQLLLVCSGDIEINLSPKTKNQVSFCHWNLNGFAVHNFTKVSQLQVLSVTHDHDIICLSEAYFK